MSISDLLFQLPAAQNWDTRLQVTYLAPAEPADPNLPAAIEEAPPPRVNIVVNRTYTEQTDPRVECRNFLVQTARAVPGLEEVENAGPLHFDDEVIGVVTVVSFSATPHIRLIQLHAFRIDDGILTQLVGTLAEGQPPQQREELRKMLQSFALK